MSVSTRKRARGKRSGDAAIHALAVKTVVQILFATSKPYTVETLRQKLREFFLDEGDWEKRAVASLSTVELVTAIIEASPTLASVGLKISLSNGMAQLSTTRLESRPLANFLAERSERAGPLTQAALEVLACVAIKQPISQNEIDRLFGDVDKRHLVFVLREAEMVEEFSVDGRLQFATTAKFLRHFGLESPDEIRKAFQEAELERQKQGQFGFLE